MTSIDALVAHWRMFDGATAPFLHHRDVPFARRGLDQVEAQVWPYPFVGNLARADVWLLMLNSKLGENDAQEESEEPYRSLFRHNLHQEFIGQEYPLLSVNPALAHTGTYRYYNHTKGLGAVITKLAERAGCPKEEARRTLAHRVAILELLPYRSARFPGGLNQLPSVNLARAAAREASLSKLLVVPWAIDRWGLRRGQNVLNRPARMFSFAPGGESGYGEAIVERLLQPIN